MKHYLLTFLLLFSFVAHGANDHDDFDEKNQAYDSCILNEVKGQVGDRTLSAVRDYCLETVNATDDEELALLEQRFRLEERTEWNRFAITPHRRNYFLPYTHTSKVNREVYESEESWSGNLRHSEAKLQTSFKIPINKDYIFFPDDEVNFAFTLKSWWQLYASDISRPFRETNYKPELFYTTRLDWRPLDSYTRVALGVSHESNGRSGDLSRSWNRIYTELIFEKAHFALFFRPWYRIPEREKDDPNDSDGDDNPDIEAYMGHFEVDVVYREDEHEYSLMLRNNLRTSDNRGAFKLGYSFPMYGRLKGFVQYFQGYGDSMIDYDISVRRLGVGILLTDLL